MSAFTAPTRGGGWAFSRLGPADVTCPADLIGLRAAVQSGRVPYAGGTDILLRGMRNEGELPPLVWTPAVKELREIGPTGDAIRLGAAVTMRQAAESTELRRLAPALAESADLVGSVQIRQRATLAGNLCNASPAADTVPALAVQAASVEVDGPAGLRQVPVTSFTTGPGRTALAAGEFVSAVTIRALRAREGSCYRRFTVRESMDLAFVGVAVLVQLDAAGEVIEDARVALGAVGPTVLDAPEASRLMRSRRPTPELLRDAGEAAAAGCHPISDLRASAEYRRTLVRVLVGDVVAEAVARARGGR